MSRIKLTYSMKDIIVEMGGGNPGALRVCCELISEGPNIDPDASALATVSTLLMLDTCGIYESHIYILYNDYCKGSIAHLIALTRGVQLGIISKKDLKMASEADYGSHPLNVHAVFEKVKECLPKFAEGIENLEAV